MTHPKYTGIFGGSFNPPTIAHYDVAKYLIENNKFDEIWWIPARQNPLKAGKKNVKPELRLKMLKAALKNYPSFKILDYELNRECLSYTIDTIVYLIKTYKDKEFKLIIGADNLASLDKWKSIERIIELVEITVMTRPGYKDANIPEKWNHRIKLEEVPALPVSSTLIREKLFKGSEVGDMLDKEVLSIIRENNLYMK